MAVSYKKLWKLLIDRRYEEKRSMCGGRNQPCFEWRKLGKNEMLLTDVLVKICTALQCDIGDIMELTQETTK